MLPPAPQIMRLHAQLQEVSIDTEEFFGWCDADRNGCATLSEFHVGLSHVPQLALTDEEVKLLFESIDRDGTGLIEFDEIAAVMRGTWTGREAGGSSQSGRRPPWRSA